MLHLILSADVISNTTSVCCASLSHNSDIQQYNELYHERNMIDMK